MEISYTKNNLVNHAVLWSGELKSEIATECVLSDNLPDIGSIIDFDGQIYIKNKQLIAGSLEIQYELSVSILYQNDNDNLVYAVNTKTETRITKDYQDDKNTIPYVTLSLHALDIHAVGARRISVNAEVLADVKIFRREEREIIKGIASCEYSIETLVKNQQIKTVSDIREKTFVITDDFALPVMLNGACSILSQRIEPVITDRDFSAERLIFHGYADISLLLNNGEYIVPYSARCEFSQVMEADGECEYPPEISLSLTGAYFDMPGSGNARLSTELHLLAQVIYYKKADFQCIADAYSNQYLLHTEFETQDCYQSQRIISMHKTLNISLESGPSIAEIVSTKLLYSTIAVKTKQLDVSFTLKCLYRDNDGKYKYSEKLVHEAWDIDSADDEAVRFCDYTVENMFTSSNAGHIESRFGLNISLIAEKKSCLSYLSALSLEEGEIPKPASFTVLYNNDCADLWKIAKEYHSTTAALEEVNKDGISGMILIPKCR